MNAKMFVVMAVVYCARTAEKVDIIISVLVGDYSSLGICKHLGKVSAVRTND